MNATERARRSDSLYYDTSVTNRRALCDMIANLESDLEDTKARNAKTFEVGKRWMAKAARFESENEKLRELISIMAYCIQGWRECDGCRVNGGAGIITERAGCSVLLDRLRELGVDVPDGD